MYMLILCIKIFPLSRLTFNICFYYYLIKCVTSTSNFFFFFVFLYNFNQPSNFLESKSTAYVSSSYGWGWYNCSYWQLSS